MSHPNNSWMIDAKCAPQNGGPDPEIFFQTSTQEAEKFCNGCPVRLQCILYAKRNDVQGYWGSSKNSRTREQRRLRKDFAEIQARAQRLLQGEPGGPTVA